MNNDYKRFKIAASAVFLFFFLSTSVAAEKSGEELYKYLSQVANSKGDPAVFKKINSAVAKLHWNGATEMEFVGYVRHLNNDNIPGSFYAKNIYLIRKVPDQVFIIKLPDDISMIDKDADSLHAGLGKMTEDQMRLKIKVLKAEIDGNIYLVADFVKRPEKILLARMFKAFITVMLFLVMLGMGLTLTIKDFALVFTKPRAIIIGAMLQWAFMPFLAMLIGRLLGFYDQYPYIFVGMILVVASPGGVTSNVLTHLAKGDLALSVSLTSFSTVLSLVLTPMVLALYCANVPEVTVPVKLIVGSILILVLIPLLLGMLIRGKWEQFAERSTKFFTVLGIVSLLILIVVGFSMCGEFFSDTERYGLKFYLVIFVLTMIAMISGIIFSKLFGINNYQTRAISLETGLRNGALAVTIAFLIQDRMGDFYSSILFTSGLFAVLGMVTSAMFIFSFKYLLPISRDNVDAADAAMPAAE